MGLSKIGLIKNKQGWLRIVEAFISVMLIMGVVLVVVSKAQPKTSTADEIRRIQKYALDYVTNDETLRNQILSGNLMGVNDKLKSIIPGNLNYLIRVCNFNDVCSFTNGSKGIIVSTEVYSDEAPIFANLTYYDPANPKKLKLFFWEGNYPADVTPPNYSVRQV